MAETMIDVAADEWYRCIGFIDAQQLQIGSDWWGIEGIGCRQGLFFTTTMTTFVVGFVSFWARNAYWINYCAQNSDIRSRDFCWVPLIGAYDNRGCRSSSNWGRHCEVKRGRYLVWRWFVAFVMKLATRNILLFLVYVAVSLLCRLRSILPSRSLRKCRQTVLCTLKMYAVWAVVNTFRHTQA